MYTTANVSGGHLNPAVTFAQCLTGHSSWERGALYAIAQVLGGVWGALVQVLRFPISHVISMPTADAQQPCQLCQPQSTKPLYLLPVQLELILLSDGSMGLICGLCCPSCGGHPV